jgi:FtsP/CotA-like multicopper oxidase with cupredoxin domain
MRDTTLSLPLSRRAFVRTVSAAGGAFATTGLLGSCDTEPVGPHDHHAPPADPAGARGTPATRNRLYLPSVVSPAGLLLTAAPGTVVIATGKNTTAWCYNGRLPGPTIQAMRGEEASITFTNQLDQASITHWHGLVVDHLNDGHPHQVVGKGASYSYAFTVDQRAALHWYHPHPHMTTGEQVYRGLAGAFVVRDAVDTGTATNPLGLPSGAYEVPLVIRDVSLDSGGALQFSGKASGFWGKTPLVNGTMNPYLPVDRAVYRLRVLNGCNARVLRLALSAGSFTLVGNDGGLLDAPYGISEITLSGGERADLLVDARGLAAGAAVMLRDLDTGWDVLQLLGTGLAAGAGAGTIPTGALSTITPLGAPLRTRRFTFDGMTRINGKPYDMDAIEFTVPFGEVERWVFVTNGNGPHPVHVHGTHFQVVSRTGGRAQTYAWEKGWKDTVLVNDGETVEVLVRFDGFRGIYVMHCHQLAHEDAGMMANFEVV